MQHDHVLKMLNFDLLTPPTGYVCKICTTNFAALMIPFNAINNIDHVLKKLTFDFLTPSSKSDTVLMVVGWVGAGLRAKYLLPSCCICDSL